MSQRHLPVYPPEWRLHKHFQERLQRGGAPLPAQPRVRVPRPRRRRTVPLWQVAEVARKVLRDVALGTALGLVSLFGIVGPVARGMGWL
jgi:hypothetical protein